MKSELESYKEDNSKQSFQIISLKNDIKDLEDLIACLTRIKSLKSINIQSLDRGNWDLNERIIELENRLRVHLVEREKAEQKADLLEKKLAGANGFTPYMNMTGQEDTLGSFTIKKLLGQLASLLSSSVVPIPAPEEAVKERIREIGANEPSWEPRTKGPRQEIQMLTKQLEQLHHRREESAQTEEKCRDQNKPLKHLEGKVAVNDFFQGRLGLGRNKENSRTKNSQIGENSKMFKQLEKDNKQQTLLNIKQNLQIATTQRLEEEIQQLQKQLSDLKLSNKNMKTQLKRVNVLKRVSFRETIMKMLGFNMKTADKEIITHLRLVIQAYETSNKSKIASDCEPGQNNA